MVHGKARVLPVDEAGGQMGGDELFLQKKPDHHTTEVLRHSMDVAEGHVDKLAPLIEPPPPTRGSGNTDSTARTRRWSGTPGPLPS